LSRSNACVQLNLTCFVSQPELCSGPTSYAGGGQGVALRFRRLFFSSSSSASAPLAPRRTPGCVVYNTFILSSLTKPPRTCTHFLPFYYPGVPSSASSTLPTSSSLRCTWMLACLTSSLPSSITGPKPPFFQGVHDDIELLTRKVFVLPYVVRSGWVRRICCIVATV